MPEDSQTAEIEIPVTVSITQNDDGKYIATIYLAGMELMHVGPFDTRESAQDLVDYLKQDLEGR